MTRIRRTKAQLERHDNLVASLVAQSAPVSVRNIYYQLVAMGEIPKTEKAYKNLDVRMVKMRRNGMIAYSDIVDAGRAGQHYYGARLGPEEWLSERIDKGYRSDPWNEEEVPHVEIWCESSSVAGMLNKVAVEHRISITACRGFSSLTLAYNGAGVMNWRTEDLDRPIRILYVGDYDPAGVLIDQSLFQELCDHCNSWPEITRVAVNEEQITEMNLPTRPRKHTDLRAQHIQETVETEAIPAGTLREMVADAVKKLIPECDERLEKATALDSARRDRFIGLVKHIKPYGIEGAIDKLKLKEPPAEDPFAVVDQFDWA